MFVTGTHRAAALRQEGHVYRPDAEPDRPPSGGLCL
jgi:hypothetical protein